MDSARPPTSLTQKQRELLNWFAEYTQPLAEAYEGAIRLLGEKEFPGRMHFIAHAVRDIADRLVYVLDAELTGTRVQYERDMDRIAECWPMLQAVTEASDLVVDQDALTINYKLARMIDSLVVAHRKRRQGPSHYDLLFRLLMQNEPSRAEVNGRLVSDFKRTRQWFMDLVHFRHDKAPEVDEDELHSQFGKFEGMLHSFVGNFFTGTTEIDEILRKANQC